MSVKTRQKKVRGRKGRARAYADHKTHPIKAVEDRRALLGVLKSAYDVALTPSAKFIADRNYMVVMLGMYSALRAEDLLQMTVDRIDFRKGVIRLYEAKTRKLREIWVSQDCVNELSAYCSRNGFSGYDHIFPSRQSVSRLFKEGITTKTDEPCVTKRRMEEVVKEACAKARIKYRVGLHGLRKTFGYLMKEQLGMDTEAIRDQYGHANTTVTEVYIEWTSEDSENVKPKFLKLQ